MTDALDRRGFLTSAAAAGLGLALAGAAGKAAAAQPVTAPAPEMPFKAPPIPKVRVGFIGVGNQGSGHFRNFLRIENAEIVAVCDLIEAKVARMQDAAVKAGKPKPQGYFKGPEDYKNLCAREDVDLVYIVTPWELHAPMLVEAMKHGKHACTEVPAAYTLDSCWEIVETAEKTQRHCVMMENCNYSQFALMMYNLVRKGVLGEVLHGECGYLHDLRALKMGNNYYENNWRVYHSVNRNGNLYPTHGLGPIANAMDINRGDQFEYLVSMSTISRGLAEYGAEHLPADDPRRKLKFALGDVNSSLIRTKNGRTILVTHNVDNPRPYSRVDLLQGTKGIVEGYPEPVVYVEGKSAKEHTWDKAEEWFKNYDHPLWTNKGPNAKGSVAKGAGHGGMDFLEDMRLVECLVKGEPTDMNVYDAAALSSVCAVSEQSVANRSNPVDFPDFTRGRWKTWKPWAIVEG